MNFEKHNVFEILEHLKNVSFFEEFPKKAPTRNSPKMKIIVKFDAYTYQISQYFYL